MLRFAWHESRIAAAAMDIELIAGFRTQDDVRAAQKALARAGISRERVNVTPTRSAGSIDTRSPAVHAAFLGLVLGALSGAIIAVLLPMAPARAAMPLFQLALFGAILGAAVGAFVGGTSTLSLDGADDTDSRATSGFVLRVHCEGADQRLVVSEILHKAHAAMLARESRTRRARAARAL